MTHCVPALFDNRSGQMLNWKSANSQGPPASQLAPGSEAMVRATPTPLKRQLRPAQAPVLAGVNRYEIGIYK